MAESPGRDFYDRQLTYLGQKDVDGLVENQYHEDARIVSFDFIREGREELRQHFRGYLAHLGYIELISTDKFTETDDSIFFEATVDTQNGVARVYDVFMLDDGRATHHFTGLLSFEPHEQQEG